MNNPGQWLAGLRDWYLTNIPVGIYRVEAEADNIVRVVSSVDVRADQETEVEITFPDETY